MNGLLLTGGKSQRMGRDKAALILRDGQTQTERGLSVLRSVCSDSYMSVASTAESGNALQLPDILPDAGPLAGLHAAFQKAPETTWFVLACDLPLIENHVLEQLSAAAAASPDRAFAYRNRLDGRAEPLCAIYPPAARKALSHWLAADKRCARHFLESLNPILLDLPEEHPHALDNANTPEDITELEAVLTGATVTKSVTILLFAQLRDQVGQAEVSLSTTATTAAATYDEFRMSHGLALKRQDVRVAINGDFAPWSTAIAEGDELAFLPPVSGG